MPYLETVLYEVESASGEAALNKLHTGADRVFLTDTLDRLFTRKSHAAHLRF